MKRSTVKTLFSTKPEGQEIVVKGWVRSIRVSKNFSFIVLNDGSCQKDIQIIADQTLEGYDEFTKCLSGSSFSIVGKLVESGGKQPIEVQAISVEILGTVPQDYPLQKKGYFYGIFKRYCTS